MRLKMLAIVMARQTEGEHSAYLLFDQAYRLDGGEPRSEHLGGLDDFYHLKAIVPNFLIIFFA